MPYSHARSKILRAAVNLSQGNDQDLVAAAGVGAGYRVFWHGFNGTFSVSIDVKDGTTSLTGVVTASSSNPQLSPFPYVPNSPPYGELTAGNALKVSVGTSGVMRGILFYSIERVPKSTLA